jgi:quercetin dioxygenase-like cupin family protein
MKKLLVFATLIALAAPALAQDAMTVTRLKPGELQWKDNPSLPKGAKTAILQGDPAKPGEMFVVRIKVPPNYQFPAHTHPVAHNVTVISGSIFVGEGDKLDTQKGKQMKAGSYIFMPAKHAHFAWTTNEGAVIQDQNVGPGGIDYVNPADDPRKK